MKHNNKESIGKNVKIIFSNDALEILKIVSINTWIYEVPSNLISLIDCNFDISLEAIKYVPNIYFKLNNKFRNDKQLIKAAIKSFRKHNRISEIDIKARPLVKKGFSKQIK